MPIYHCTVKNISRGSGKSAVASASYRSGEKLQDERQGLTFQYKKNEVAYSEIFLCENAPKEYQDRGTLWNAVEQAEKQSNSRLAREWEVAIPNELTLEQSKELIKEFAQSLADEGMCVDANIHWKDGNHHAHIMGTTRPIKENGEWGAKEKKAYKLDENGQKIPQLDENGEQKFRERKGKGRELLWERELVDSTGWNREEKVLEWRDRWEDMTNKALEKAHIQERVSAKSYEEQGIERIPTIHEGHVAREMEQKGQVSERCEINRDIQEANRQLEQLQQEQNLLVRLLEQLREKVKEAIYERLERLNARRTANESARADAERIREAGEREPSSTIKVSKREKEILSHADEVIRGNGTARSQELGSESIGELLRDIRAERRTQQIEERQSAEKRDDKIAQRQARDSERERQRAEAKRQAEARERELAKAKERSLERSRDDGFHR